MDIKNNNQVLVKIAFFLATLPFILYLILLITRLTETPKTSIGVDVAYIFLGGSLIVMAVAVVLKLRWGLKINFLLALSVINMAVFALLKVLGFVIWSCA